MLTYVNALKAMEFFLDSYFQRDKGEDLALILSDINLDTFYGGMTADPAAWEDWLESIEKIKCANHSQLLSTEDAFGAMIVFLRAFANRIKSKEIMQLLNEILIDADKNHATSDILNKWALACKKATLFK